MPRMSDYPAKASPTTSDLLLIVDIEDASQSPQGSTKQTTVGEVLALAPSGAVSSVFGRTGAITAQSGDYTAAQVGSLPVPSGTASAGLVPVATGTGNASKWQSVGAQFFAVNFGVVADGATDNGAALNSMLQTMWSLGGGVCVLPEASNAIGKQVMTGRTIIIPPNCVIEGQGIETTTVVALTGSNCDVFQFMQYNSSAQAAILGVSASTLKNAFYSGLRDLAVHGNQANQAATSYNHGLTAVTNPLTTTAPNDPDFDPYNFVDNVEFRKCTGDGIFANGRSGLRVTRCLSRYNYGNGLTTSFDTITTTSNFGENGMAGVYVNHGSSDGAGNKSYNNGANAQWVSGSNYSALTRVMYNGALYAAINALTNDTVVPSSDPTNWAALTASSPAAWGTGYYFDSASTGCAWSGCDAQENSASSYYLHGCNAIAVEGTASAAGFGATGAQSPVSASLTLDGATGCNVSLTSLSLNSHAYVLRVVNAATHNQVILAGDASGTGTVSADSITLPGSGNDIRWNGASLTTLTLPSFSAGTFGDGSDGAVTLDGSTTYAGFSSLAGSTYTLTRDVFASSLTINSGVTVKTANYAIFCTGIVTNNGTIANNGNAAAGSTAGAATGAVGTLGSGGSGGAGQTTAGSAASAIGLRVGVGAGGAGGTGSGGIGGAGVPATGLGTWYFKYPARLLNGSGVSNAGSGVASALCGGGGGGGGGGDSANKGGGGGGGGGIVVISAPTIINGATGSITSTGGIGAAGVAGNASGGGGGAGGLIALYTTSAWTNSGTTSVAGGTAGSGVGTGVAGVNGSNGTVNNMIIQ